MLVRIFVLPSAGAHLVEGRAAVDEILDLAGQIGAGLIVIGSRGG